MQVDIEQMYKKNPERYQNLYVQTAYSYILVYSKAVERFQNDMNINPYMLGIFCDNLIENLKNWIGEKDDAIKDMEKQLRIKIDMLKKFGYRKADKSELNGEEDAKKLIDQIELKEECEKLNDEPQTDDPKEYLRQYAEMLRDLLKFFQTSDNMFVKNNISTPIFQQEYEKYILALEEDSEESILFLYSQIKIGHAEHYVKVANFIVAEKDYKAAYDKLKILMKQEHQIYNFFLCGVCAGLSITLSHLNKHQEAENILVEGIGICEELAEHENQYYRLLARMYTNYVVLCRDGRVYDCISKGMNYSQKAYDLFKKQVDILDDTEKATFINLCYNYGLLFIDNGKYLEALKYLLECINIIELLNERSIQENYNLINKVVLMTISIGKNIGDINQIKKKIECLYSTETIESLISNFDKNMD